MDKKDEETHAMDKPKPLEVVSDGDLSEVKKDPVWKTWLKQKDALDPKARKDEKYIQSTYSEGGRTSSGKLKPSKTTRSGVGWGFGGYPYSYDSTEDVGGGQSYGKQSKQVREEGTEYRGLEEPRQSQSVMPHEQDYNRQNRTELKHPEKFRTSHLPMDRHIMSKKPAKGERSMDKLDEKGKPKHEKIYSEPDRRYQTGWDEDASKRGEKDTMFHESSGMAGTPKDEMTRTETIIHDKIPKGGEAPKGKKHPLGYRRGRAPLTDEQEEAKKEQREKREKKRKLQQKLDVLSQNSKQSNKKKAWEVWLDNVTKPIPDSKGGRGSFQHCIDANQDKNNPGGWCKQIERKISKAKKKKEVKLPQTKIDEPKHWWDHSKVGRQGDIDQKTGRPWWEVATEEKERRKREAKEKTDYFVEEIRSNIIYHNKVFPLIGMIAGQAARGLGKLGKKVGSEVLEGAGQVGQHMMEQEAQDEEEQ